jgi:hypothetical protein
MDYAERTPPEPPCESCRVELVSENEDAGRIFMMVRGQCLSRFNGKYDVAADLNHLAVWAAIDAYGVRDRTGCFERVCRAWHKIQAERRDDEG